MKAYCKNCHSEHAAWSRLTDGYICGLCGARERDPQVKPINAAERDGSDTHEGYYPNRLRKSRV